MLDPSGGRMFGAEWSYAQSLTSDDSGRPSERGPVSILDRDVARSKGLSGPRVMAATAGPAQSDSRNSWLLLYDVGTSAGWPLPVAAGPGISVPHEPRPLALEVDESSVR